MISINDLKYYSSLLIKKDRVEEKKFIVEGIKTVEEGLRNNLTCEVIFITATFSESNPDKIKLLRKSGTKMLQLKSSEFARISDTKSPQGIAAVFIKSNTSKKLSEVDTKKLIFIDNISDPGNLGTILRTCDWFGFEIVLLGKECVEFLNPKVVRASMGSIFHINIYESILEKDLVDLKRKGYQILCSDIQGKDLFTFRFEKKSVIVFSNESFGPSQEIKNLTDDFITIPSKGKAESLNVAAAAAIILARFANE
jgi:TrmH family RNA methyltransferase